MEADRVGIVQLGEGSGGSEPDSVLALSTRGGLDGLQRFFSDAGHERKDIL